MFEDLRQYLAALEARSEFVRVREPVSPNLELGAIAKRLMDEQAPSVLFESVEGSPMPVLTNLFPNRSRVALALDVGLKDILQRWLDCLAAPIEPEMVTAGPC